MATRAELETAYRATTYRIFLPGGPLDLRVGVSHPGLAAWLVKNHVREWGVLTAANPASELLLPRQNAECQAKLECALLEAGYEPFVAENLADDGNWPVEEACFVAGIPAAEALNLARQFGQNAVLLGGADGLPFLAWMEEYKK